MDNEQKWIDWLDQLIDWTPARIVESEIIAKLNKLREKQTIRESTRERIYEVMVALECKILPPPPQE